MSETPSAEKDAATLTDKEIELREWLRSQPGGAERWTVIKAGFRRSYDMGMRDSLNARLDAEKDRPRATVAQAVAAWEAKGPTSLTVALMAEALYGVHDAFSEFVGRHSAALHTIAQDPRDPEFADDWCALAALATTVQTRVLPPGGSDA